MTPMKQLHAIDKAINNRKEWNIGNIKFFAMGLTAAGIASVVPAGLVPIVIASGSSAIAGMLAYGYMAHQNQKVINALESKPFNEVQNIIKDIDNLSINSSISNIAKGIKAMRRNDANNKNTFNI